MLTLTTPLLNLLSPAWNSLLFLLPDFSQDTSPTSGNTDNDRNKNEEEENNYDEWENYKEESEDNEDSMQESGIGLFAPHLGEGHYIVMDFPGKIG